MKTLAMKPVIEVLEDRLALSSSPFGPTSPPSGREKTIEVIASLRAGTATAPTSEEMNGALTVGARTSFQVGNAHGDVLTYIEQDNLYKLVNLRADTTTVRVTG
jgi:hypothetical protein